VEKIEGATIAGHHCFVTSPLLSFLFLGHVFAVAPAFFWFRTIVSVWLLYLYSGVKAYIEEDMNPYDGQVGDFIDQGYILSR
jgi:hypothetical protein